MVISVKDSEEAKHWSAVDLWSDGQRRPLYSEALMPADQVAEFDALREAGIGVGTPVPLTASTVTDSELLPYLASPAMSGSTYFLLRLACSFKKGKGERFSSADLKVRLTRQDTGRPQAIAWSMSPPVMLDGDDRTDTFTLGAGLKFINAAVSRQHTASQGTLVRTYGLMTSSPAWGFTATPAAELEGSFELGMIVCAPAGAGVTGQFTLDVVVDQPHRLTPDKSATVKGAASTQVPFHPLHPAD
jgi:hypothetical protein